MSVILDQYGQPCREFVVPKGMAKMAKKLLSTPKPPPKPVRAAPVSGLLPSFVPKTPEEFAEAIKDPMWRLCSGQLYKIMLKSPDGEDTSVVPFIPNQAQMRLIARMWHRNIILKARQLGFCVDQSTRVLTASLEWVKIGDIEPGTEIVAVDEHVPGGRGSARKMRTAVVQAVRKMQAERFRISFDDGRSVICTANHPWLSRKVATDATWRSLSGEGNSVTGKLCVGTKVRWITKPWESANIQDGWFGGMLDGEGSMALPSRCGASVNVSQRPGPVWDRLEKYALGNGYHARTESDSAERPGKHGKVPVPKLTFTRMDELFRLIGQTRPTRFIDRRWWEGRELPGKRNGDVGWATITEIEPLGIGEVVDMQTSTGTYIAEGFVSHNTTLVAIMWLDHALFNADQRCGIIAQGRDEAEIIFRDKVKLAYERLPEVLREAMPLKRDSASELLFGHNNSSVRVATSMRSGTIHRLHISEYGKICAKYPDKAAEVITGSLPSVPIDGIIIIESTAEGQEGDFFAKTQRALSLAQLGVKLSERDYRMHFYAWWQDPAYRLAHTSTPLSIKDHEYFDKIQAEAGTILDNEQRNWYVATRDADFSEDPERMWQEYPSTAREAFQVSTEGCYYAEQLSKARIEGRIGKVPFLPGVKVNTFWDIGNTDGTAIWFHQRVGYENRFINFDEGWGESYSYFTSRMQVLGYTWGTHYLPHDAKHKRQGQHANKSPEDMLRELDVGGTWEIVPVVDEVIHGIQATRDVFGTCYFDEEKCRAGLAHIANYKKTWDKAKGAWKIGIPQKVDGHSEAADALRQFGQGYFAPALIVERQARRGRNWRVS